MCVYTHVNMSMYMYMYMYMYIISLYYTQLLQYIYIHVCTIILLYYCTQAMDELKVMLDDNNVDFSETELVINENGIPGGPLNASIEGLSDVFVSRCLCALVDMYCLRVDLYMYMYVGRYNLQYMHNKYIMYATCIGILCI